MKLLGHSSADMTMLYLDIALTDLQREFHLARSKPRHLVPQPKVSSRPSPRTGLGGLIDSLLAAQHTMEMFRRSLPAVASTASPIGSPRSSQKPGKSCPSGKPA
jgi:hypothetical protein